jgi:hypothetical protein
MPTAPAINPGPCGSVYPECLWCKYIPAAVLVNIEGIGNFDPGSGPDCNGNPEVCRWDDSQNDYCGTLNGSYLLTCQGGAGSCYYGINIDPQGHDFPRINGPGCYCNRISVIAIVENDPRPPGINQVRWHVSISDASGVGWHQWWVSDGPAWSGSPPCSVLSPATLIRDDSISNFGVCEFPDTITLTPISS